MRFTIFCFSLLLSSLPCYSQDNSLLLKGSIVAVQQTVTSGVTTWDIAVRTSKGDIFTRCNSGTVESMCSQFSTTSQGSVPTFLATGGCYPVQQASSGGGSEQITVWVCGGSGGGVCRIINGWVEPAESLLSKSVTGSLSFCF